MVNLTERVERLEIIVGEGPDDGRDVATSMAEHEEQILDLRHVLAEVREDLHGQVAGQQEGRALLETLAAEVQRLKEEVAILQRLSNRQLAAEITTPKIRIPEPKPFNGARDAKVLENFLWDVEQYFIAAKVPEVEKVNLAGMFLTEDAKLWWRTRIIDDHNAERPRIVEWETLKKELKIQFLPHNTAWLAREAMKKLKQTGSVRDYVKSFSSLLLDVPTMGEDDKVFNFMTGLQNWAQIELRRQGVRDLPSAMAAAESLADFRSAPTIGQGDEKKPTAKKPQSSIGWKKKKADAKVFQPSTIREAKPKPEGFAGCFICGGPHLAMSCPKKERVNALTTQKEEASSSSDGEIARLSPLQLISALVTEAPQVPRGLLYAKVRANGKELKAMLDTGSSSNFIVPEVAQELGLQIGPSSALLKAMNAKSVRIHGETKVALEVGPWRGECSFQVHPLDDFQMILGLDFFQQAKVMIIPHLKGMLIGEKHCTSFEPLVMEAMEEVGADKVLKVQKGKQTMHIAALVQSGARQEATHAVCQTDPARSNRCNNLDVHSSKVQKNPSRHRGSRGKRGGRAHKLASSTGPTLQKQRQVPVPRRQQPGAESASTTLHRSGTRANVQRCPARSKRKRGVSYAQWRPWKGEVQRCACCQANLTGTSQSAARYGTGMRNGSVRCGGVDQGHARKQWKGNQLPKAIWVKVESSKGPCLEDNPTWASAFSGGGRMSQTQ